MSAMNHAALLDLCPVCEILKKSAPLGFQPGQPEDGHLAMYLERRFNTPFWVSNNRKQTHVIIGPME